MSSWGRLRRNVRVSLQWPCFITHYEFKERKTTGTFSFFLFCFEGLYCKFLLATRDRDLSNILQIRTHGFFSPVLQASVHLSPVHGTVLYVPVTLQCNMICVKISSVLTRGQKKTSQNIVSLWQSTQRGKKKETIPSLPFHCLYVIFNACRAVGVLSLVRWTAQTLLCLSTVFTCFWVNPLIDFPPLCLILFIC